MRLVESTIAETMPTKRPFAFERVQSLSLSHAIETLKSSIWMLKLVSATMELMHYITKFSV